LETHRAHMPRRLARGARTKLTKKCAALPMSCTEVCTTANSKDCTMQQWSARFHSLAACTQWLYKHAMCQQAKEACTSMAVKSEAWRSMQPCGVATPKQASTKGQASPTEGSWAVKHQRSKATAGRKQSTAPAGTQGEHQFTRTLS